MGVKRRVVPLSRKKRSKKKIIRPPKVVIKGEPLGEFVRSKITKKK